MRFLNGKFEKDLDFSCKQSDKTLRMKYWG